VALRSGQPIPLSAFRLDIATAAAHLRRRGCRRGALVCRDSYLFLVGLFALLAVGADAVIPANSQAGTLAALRDAWDLLVTDEPALSAPCLVLPAAAEPAAEPLPETIEGNLVLFTSGSTGQPKRIVRRLSELNREIAELEHVWGDAAGHAIVHTTVPHHHIYGLTFARLWPLAAARPFDTAVCETWEALLATLARGVIISSPAHLARLGGIAPVAAARQPRLVFSAGAPLSLRSATEAADVLGRSPTEIFGSTETGAIATRVQSGEATPWQPLPGIGLDRQADGRLRIRSPWVDGGQWFGTEDRIEWATAGTDFHLAGRADRIVKIEGKRVALVDVEQRLMALPWIAEAAAVVLSGDPETLAAAAVLTPEGDREYRAIGGFRFTRLLRRELAAYHEPTAMPRRWRFVPQLPAGTMGKPNAAAIAALFANREPTLNAPRCPRVDSIHRSPGEVRLDLTLLPELLWFQGHFPGAPLLPGVTQIDWAIGFAREHLGLTLPSARLFKVKFRKVMRPREAVVLVLRHDAAKSHLTFEYRRGDEICAAGQVTVPS
jgi:3-hydroxymyristoyl/3-hydroxydecanoyl-(acyl carrier protein) dehydratase